MSSNGNSDDDVTKPDLPSGLGHAEEPTSPGVGTGEAYFAVLVNADRAMAALKAWLARAREWERLAASAISKSLPTPTESLECSTTTLGG